MLLVTHEPTRKIELSENIWFITEDFLLIRMLCFCFLHLNIMMRVFFFFQWWHAWRSSGFTSWPVRDNALLMLLSKTSPIVAGTEFISSNSQQWYHSSPTGQFFHSVISYSFYWQLALKKGVHIVSENHQNDWWDQIVWKICLQHW